MVYWCCRPGPHWLPFLVAVGTPLTFVITYVISVLNGHVEAGFPYISDTGTNSPESCIFGQLLNINAVLVGIVVYIRYKQIIAYYRNEAIVQLYILKLNKASLIIGILAGLGLSVVANFQETNVLAVHLIGAFTGFACGCIYAWIHAVISYKMQAFVTHRAVCHLRLFLAIVVTLFFVLTSIFGMLSIRFKPKTGTKWFPDNAELKKIHAGNGECVQKINRTMNSIIDTSKLLPEQFY
ncbi:DNA damage-regulated autophagy modulator protein 2-like isoform X3 [Tubulanus polymorphus]|uniref:DNA damage-regulated autophagy modulator protein 2-like isoform X3 n=1 Tax=Tubulanus polymorphus TaxID=672921 RepID=UPI003DA60DAF